MKTCEEYVLNELEKTKKAKEELEDEHQLALTEYKTLIDLVVQGTEHFRLEDDGTYVKVYFDDGFFMILENKKDLGDLEGLVNLILKGKTEAKSQLRSAKNEK